LNIDAAWVHSRPEDAGIVVVDVDTQLLQWGWKRQETNGVVADGYMNEEIITKSYCVPLKDVENIQSGKIKEIWLTRNSQTATPEYCYWKYFDDDDGWVFEVFEHWVPTRPDDKSTLLIIIDLGVDWETKIRDGVRWCKNSVTDPYWVSPKDAKKIQSGEVREIWLETEPAEYKEWKYQNKGKWVRASGTSSSTELLLSTRRTLIIDVANQPTKQRRRMSSNRVARRLAEAERRF